MATLLELDRGTTLVDKSIFHEAIKSRPKVVTQIPPNFFEARYGKITVRLSFSSSVFFEGERFNFRTSKVRVYSNSADYMRLFQGKNQEKDAHLGRKIGDLPVGKAVGMDKYLYSTVLFLAENEIISTDKLPVRILKSIFKRGQRAALNAAVYGLIGSGRDTFNRQEQQRSPRPPRQPFLT